MNIAYFKRIVILLPVLTVLLGCSTKEEAPFLKLTGRDTYEIGPSGEDLVIGIDTNQASWDYEKAVPDWIRASKSGANLRLSISSNDDYAIREATVSIVANAGTGTPCSASVRIIQAANDTAPELSVDGPVDIELPYTGGESIVHAKTNLKKIFCRTDAEWLEATVDGNYVYVSAAANGVEEERKGKLVIFGPSENNPLVSVELNFVQAAMPPQYPAENLSASGTSNCYLVSHPGKYFLDATVCGNGCVVEGLKAPNALAPASAELLWQSQKGMFKSVSYKDGQIGFEISDIHGNALLAARDASGKIVWSWHIWYPDDEPKGLETSEGSIMMDRNLGAVNTDHTSVSSYGLLYQWGRKDPFPGSPIKNGGTTYTLSVPVYDMDGKEVKIKSSSMYNTNNNHLAYSIANPTECLSNNAQYQSGCRDWLAKGENMGALWGNPRGFERQETDYPNKGVKTLYDPCPLGWRVPHSSVFKIMASNLGMIWAQGETEGIMTWTSIFDSAEFYGYDYNGDGLLNLKDYFDGWYITVNRDKGIHSYFPATTRYDGQYAMFMGSMVGLWGNYWYNSPSGTKQDDDTYVDDNSLAMSMSFSIKEYGVTDDRYTIIFSSSSNASRADAYALRCIRE